MTQAARRAAQRAAYNQGFRDSLNNLPATPSDPLLSFYYHAGYEEAEPKRLVPTTIITARGPLVEMCTLERAAYLQAANFHVPGGRR